MTSSDSVIEQEPAVAGAVFGDRVALARQYVALLAGPGIERGLLGPREAGRLWTRHLLNCAVIAELIPQGARVLDIGSGAGLPGIPVALVRPDCRVDLVEPLLRRSTFLDEMVDELALANCRVIRARADEAASTFVGADVVTARAVAPLSRLAGWAAPLLRTGGLLLAIKGSSAGDEVDRDHVEMLAAGLGGVEIVQAGVHVLDRATTVVRAVRLSPR